MIKRKKIMAVLAALAILAGSLGMTATASATVDPSTCEHPDNLIFNISYEKPYTTTTTHSVWVACKPNGDPIFATCTITTECQKYKRICSVCGQEFRNWVETLSKTHSMTHD